MTFPELILSPSSKSITFSILPLSIIILLYTKFFLRSGAFSPAYKHATLTTAA